MKTLASGALLDNSSELPTGDRVSITDLLSKFKDFCKIDLNLSDRTIDDNCGHLFQIRRFLESIGKYPTDVTEDDIRTYLAQFKTMSSSTYANVLKSLKVFFRDFLKMPDVVESFKFPKKIYTIKTVPTKEDLQRFFRELDDLTSQTVFLLYATGGMRRNELLTLTIDDIDVENRVIIPKNAHETGTTKKSGITFFNVEAQSYLRRYLANRHTDDYRVFPFTEVVIRRSFSNASKKTGLHITPQVLREWFCCQFGELGVPDRYVDAFCGRTPKSVLAKHYTDYLPEKLKRIYDNANLIIGVT